MACTTASSEAEQPKSYIELYSVILGVRTHDFCQIHEAELATFQLLFQKVGRLCARFWWPIWAIIAQSRSSPWVGPHLSWVWWNCLKAKMASKFIWLVA